MEFLKKYEEYINNPTNVLSSLLNNMVTMLKQSFQGENDVLGEMELDSVMLMDVERSITNDAIKKNIKLEFFDQHFYYQVVFIVNLNDVEKNNIEKGYLKIKIYDTNKVELIREWNSDIKIKIPTSEEITENGRFFIQVAQLTFEDDEEVVGEFDDIETFIIARIGELKEQFGL